MNITDGKTYEESLTEEDRELINKLPNCVRCNDNGCPACDGTKGSKYNPEPY